MRWAEDLDSEDFLDIFLDIIDIYCEFEEFQRAIGVCQKIYEADRLEDKSLILQRMGLIYGKMGKEDMEIESYQRALEINPNNKQVRFRLSEMYEKDGQWSEAVRVLKNRGLSTKLEVEEDQEDEEIFLSDEETGFLMKREIQNFDEQDLPYKLKQEQDTAAKKIKNVKVERLIGEIKREPDVNTKTRRRMANIVEFNEEFFINVENLIDKQMQKYNFELLLLNFKQCELGLASPNPSEDLNFQSLKKALKLEQFKIHLKENIYNMLLKESKGKIRSTFMEYSNQQTSLKKDLNYLFIFKRKKTADTESSRMESLFKESKNKSRVARKLSNTLITKMKTVPDYIGFAQFTSIIHKSLLVLYKLERFLLVAQICEILLKIHKHFEDYPEFQVDYYFVGFLAHCKIQSYEKAYVFFRTMSKYLIRDENRDKYQTLSSQLRKNENLPLEKAFREKFSAYSQIEINKVCFSMINYLFNEFSPQKTSHRIFFQKFQKQYEKSGSITYYSNLIMANNYIHSGSYETAKECLMKNDDFETNPLSNFLMGFIKLIDSTNRNNQTKIETIHEAFDYLEAYKELSNPRKMCEVYYNLGRSFSHLSMSEPALKMFAKCKDLVDDKLAQISALIEARAQETNCAIDPKKKEALEKEIRLKNLYYESTFNEMVWHYRQGNKSIANDIVRSGLQGGGDS